MKGRGGETHHGRLSRTWAGQAGLDPGETEQGRLREDNNTSQYTEVSVRGASAGGFKLRQEGDR